jgi:hypothetical protein
VTQDTVANAITPTAADKANNDAFILESPDVMAGYVLQTHRTCWRVAYRDRVTRTSCLADQVLAQCIAQPYYPL